jgi:hypothetical protein
VTARAQPRVRRGYVRAESEAAFQQALTNMATAFGWRWYHTHRSDRSVRGFPDLVLVRGTRLIFAELKTDKGVLSSHQQEWIDALATVASADISANVAVYLWRPADWPAIEQALR